MADIETTAVDANGTPIVTMKVIDKETGTETPVNVSTCAEAVVCSKGIPMEQHLANLYNHANDEGAHLTAVQKAALETQEGAQAKATAAKNEAITAASLEIAAAKTAAEADASAKATAARDAAYKYADGVKAQQDAHTADNSNPHNVTAAQVGLGNVPNKSTNDLQPTYSPAETLSALTSGEKLAVAFGKIAKAVTDFISHIGNKENPHKVTAAQAGALPISGGTMTGPLNMGGKSIFGCSSISAAYINSARILTYDFGKDNIPFVLDRGGHSAYLVVGRTNSGVCVYALGIDQDALVVEAEKICGGQYANFGFETYGDKRSITILGSSYAVCYVISIDNWNV